MGTCPRSHSCKRMAMPRPCTPTPDPDSSIYLFYSLVILTVLGLHCCPRAFSSCCEWGCSLILGHRLLTLLASVLQSVACSSGGTRAGLLCSVWSRSDQGWNAQSPAMAGRFLTTGPPGKSPEPRLLTTMRDCFCTDH